MADGTQSAVMASRKSVRIYNSKGLNLENSISGSGAYVSAIVKQDDEMYDGTEYRFEPLSEIDAKDTAQTAVARALSTTG